jgi:hypothetical protein
MGAPITAYSIIQVKNRENFRPPPLYCVLCPVHTSGWGGIFMITRLAVVEGDEAHYICMK